MRKRGGGAWQGDRERWWEELLGVRLLKGAGSANASPGAFADGGEGVPGGYTGGRPRGSMAAGAGCWGLDCMMTPVKLLYIQCEKTTILI